ncbi:hypothetical+protein [Methylocapsa aurea]|jgi:ABC-type uncharacterized transport system substrate-binding protein|uniref:DUF1007 family protein n=1 Tax=Methylocapsa aurea TaxID=663610 RepID=UPI003D18D03C
MPMRFGFAALTILATLAAGPAAAHPHVWVAVRSEVLFTQDGKIKGVRHAWTFDEMYSAFALQGLGKDGKPPSREELAPLAKTNAESLAEFDYFTFAKYQNANAAFGPPEDVWLEADDKRIVTMHFTLPLEKPLPAHKPFSFQTYDPTYFVSFDLEKQNPVTLAQAPAGCSTSVVEPKPLLSVDTQKLSEAFFANMSPGADFGMKLAARVVVACP